MNCFSNQDGRASRGPQSGGRHLATASSESRGPGHGDTVSSVSLTARTAFGILIPPEGH